MAFPNLFDPSQNVTQILQLGLSTSCFYTLKHLCGKAKYFEPDLSRYGASPVEPCSQHKRIKREKRAHKMDMMLDNDLLHLMWTSSIDTLQILRLLENGKRKLQ